MKQLFVSYGIAKLLKEKGFNEPCIAYYGTVLLQFYWNTPNDKFCRNNEQYFTGENNQNAIAPLYQQVIDWFESKNIYITIELADTFDNVKLKSVVSQYKDSRLHSIYRSGYGEKYSVLSEAIKEAIKLL